MKSLAEHQVYGSSMMDALPALGLFYEMGTGKTITVLDWAYRAFRRGEVSQVLVVCPASLKGTWAQAIDGMVEFGYDPQTVQALKGIITVTSYQMTYKRKERIVRHRNGTSSKKRWYEVRDEIDHPWDAIIVDESHCIGNHSAIQTKTMMALAPHAKHRYILTGTPVTGGGGRCDYAKLYGQMNFLEPGIFKSWTDFKSRCVLSCDPWGNPYKYREDVCEDILKSHGIVCRLTEVFDMPEVVESEIGVELRGDAKRAYNDIVKGRWLNWGFDVTSSGAQYPKLYQVCSGSLITDEGTRRLPTDKLAVLKDLIDSTDGKVIVFCNYTESIRQICEAIPGAVPLHGDTPRDNWERVQFGEDRVLVAQYVVGSAGLNLQASNLMIFFEPTLSALNLDQAKARIYRPGQRNNCRYIHLYTKGTFEEKAMRTVRSGVDVTRDMMDSWAKE